MNLTTILFFDVKIKGQERRDKSTTSPPQSPGLEGHVRTQLTGFVGAIMSLLLHL